MKLKYVFTSIIFLRCIFMAVPQTDIHPFPFAHGVMAEVRLYSYVWLLLESASFFALALILMLTYANYIKPTKDRSESVIAFAYMCGLDFLDFVLRGNSEWFMVGSYPVTNNVFTLITYTMLTWNSEETKQ